MAADPQPYYRRPISGVSYQPDARRARRCSSCGRTCIVVSSTGECGLCDRWVDTPRKAAPLTTPHLDAIRSGTWRPSPELAAYLASTQKRVLRRIGNEATAPATIVAVGKDAQEIAVCAGCGKVRLKPVGRMCGHVGTCEEQARLF